MKPNPNIWSVKYSHVDAYGRRDYSKVWVLAASISGAEQKARRCIRFLGRRQVAITGLKHKGTIDAF